MKTLLEKIHAVLEKLAHKAETPTTAQDAGDHAIQIQHARDVTIQPAPTPEPEPGLDAYLRWALHAAQELDLRGIDPKAAKQQDACLNLPDVYTALLTMTTADHEQRLAEKRDIPDRDRLRSAVEMLNAERHLVLLGDPGSGKSVFVNFTALCMAGELLGDAGDAAGCANVERLTQPLPNDKGELEDDRQPWQWGGLLPVKFVLRDVAAKTLPEQPDAPGTVKHLLDYLERLLTECGLPEALPAIKSHLEKEGGLVLFDGLDEVPEAHERRRQILDAVEAFAGRFDKCRILVTCRTYAYQKQKWRLKNFPVAVLSPFTNGQIRWFVDGWYRHVANTRDGRAELLKQAIFRSPQLRSFARRPLLLTLMASLHAWRSGSLPQKRAELYEDATDMLLETWVERKKVRAADGTDLLLPSLEEVLNVSKDEMRPVLQRLAFEAHQRQPADEQGTADIPEDDLMKGLFDLCRRHRLNQWEVAEHLSHRVGLLASRGSGVYTFPHRSFQEYLAACYLASETDYPYNLYALVRESSDRWREVALLAAAVTLMKIQFVVMFDTFVTTFCPASAPETRRSADAVDAYAAMLAAQAVAEAQQVAAFAARKPQPAQWLNAWLTAIVTEQQPSEPLPALERAQAGNLLAEFGDPRPGVGCRSLSGAEGSGAEGSGVEGNVPDIEWCNVPEGDFLMGSGDDDDEAMSREKPQHPVHVPAFEISRYPITNAQFRVFIAAGGYTAECQQYWPEDGWQWREKHDITEPRWAGGVFDLDNHPVVRVSWYEAMAFCAWLTDALTPTPLPEGEGLFVRLPSEAEWEYAARGPHSRKYPWEGPDVTPELANYDQTNINATSAVGCFPQGRSWRGVDDMAGNVWEWCLDVWQDNHKGAPDDGTARLKGKNTNLRLLKGGAWLDPSGNLRGANRDRGTRGNWNYLRGFRVVASRRPPVSF